MPTAKKKKLILIVAAAMAAVVLASVAAALAVTGCFDPVVEIDGFTLGRIAHKSELDVVALGADPTGKTDETKRLQAIHKSGKQVYYPNGTYLFNGYTLDLSGGVRFQSMDGVTVRDRISDENILRFDDFGNLVGLMQNHLELTENSAIPICGTLVSPPLSTKKYETKADLLAYWYNDFGLQCTRDAKTGWIGWYYWTWNHHDAASNKALRAVAGKQPDGYDPARHPLLGFYYGDDPKVLDWQSYWLYEYGVQNVALLAEDLTNWSEPTSTAYWAYQLFHNAPNFRNLRYAFVASTPWAKAGETEVADSVRQRWYKMIDTYAAFDNVYCLEKDGKRYPVVSLLEEKALVTVFDTAFGRTGTAGTQAFLEEIAQRFREKGFDGVALLSRSQVDGFQTDEMRAHFEKLGMLRYSSSYTPNDIPSRAFHGAMTYDEMVDAFSPAADPFAVQAIATSIDTQTPHESGWVCKGSTPAGFGRFLQKALDHLDQNPDMPRIITCYNVSEWAEGGAALQPTVGNGFGYLEAVRDALIR